MAHLAPHAPVNALEDVVDLSEILNGACPVGIARELPQPAQLDGSLQYAAARHQIIPQLPPLLRINAGEPTPRQKLNLAFQQIQTSGVLFLVSGTPELAAVLQE